MNVYIVHMQSLFQKSDGGGGGNRIYMYMYEISWGVKNCDLIIVDA